MSSIHTSQLEFTLGGNTESIIVVQFGRSLESGSSIQTARVWDPNGVSVYHCLGNEADVLTLIPPFCVLQSKLFDTLKHYAHCVTTFALNMNVVLRTWPYDYAR